MKTTPAIVISLLFSALPAAGNEAVPESIVVSAAIATAARAQADWPDGGIKLLAAQGISREGALGLIRFHQEIQVARATEASQDRNDLCSKQNLLDTEQKIRDEMSRLASVASQREQGRTDTILASLSAEDRSKFRIYLEKVKKQLHGHGYPDGNSFTVANLTALCGAGS